MKASSCYTHTHEETQLWKKESSDIGLFGNILTVRFHVNLGLQKESEIRFQKGSEITCNFRVLNCGLAENHK